MISAVDGPLSSSSGLVNSQRPESCGSSKTTTTVPPEDNDKKFNVVVFLAKTTTGEAYTQDSGIKYLNFVEKTRVKHCAGSGTDDDSLATFTGQGSDCKQLLKTGIYSLISYCRNVLGMTTAIASQENDTFSNALRFKKASEDREVRYYHPKTLKGRLGLREKPRLITNPEHTEVFKIRSKRECHFDDGQNPSSEEPPKWDVFGISASIKLTFFGKLFEDAKTQEKTVPSPETSQKQDLDQLGHVSENCLFDLVKETLSNVQEGCNNGFLMIVLGGCLKEICDIYSTLMQSVKHVVENTDERNTLIVVTGSCPPIDQATPEEQQCLIPVYMRGPPKTSSIAVSRQLYDVPYAIKNLLAEMNGGNYFATLKSKRNKRADEEVEEKRSSGGGRSSGSWVLVGLYLWRVAWE
ncbi:uncharacterized protein [Tenebrio molitor]|uniref:uncharacterized protein isoform X3 n=1 Tax=Tenebrio molitor TaxID=7067 RepID=UPI0036248186